MSSSARRQPVCSSDTRPPCLTEQTLNLGNNVFVNQGPSTSRVLNDLSAEEKRKKFFNKNLIESLNQLTLPLLTQSYKSHLPQTNNQLRASSNARNKAMVQDGKVVVQDVHGRYNATNQGRPFQRNNAREMVTVMGHIARECPTAKATSRFRLTSGHDATNASQRRKDSSDEQSLFLLQENRSISFVDHMDEYHEVHEMQNDVQHNYIVNSNADYMSDSNIIPYDQYCGNNSQHMSNKRKINGISPACQRQKNVTLTLKKDFKQKEDKFIEEFLDLKKLKDKIEDRLYKQGQFCDSDLEVAFRKHTCFVRDIHVFSDMLAVQSFQFQNHVWHRRLNHLNFGTINDLARKDLVRGLPRLKFEKDHLCSACQLGKSKKFSHRPKSENTNMGSSSYPSHGSERFNENTGTEFVHQFILKTYEGVGIFHQKSVPRTPQQNGIVERRNRTLVEAARTRNIPEAPCFYGQKL
ncbi:retrovirus-related pol polyprotein from transposon TNT 1-94 [Tanacetum coccineum]|uniref:Retrovirus-related pol polyprotein from transposon TNT 1-94 n=1 Tax=Tanacetum coccineum TaxID=301880 RepID=A0ABQ5CBT2_9ASTR